MTRPRLIVEVHFRDCACRGTGWTGAHGIAYRSGVCPSPRIVRIPIEDYEREGRPATADGLSRAWRNRCG